MQTRKCLPGRSKRLTTGSQSRFGGSQEGSQKRRVQIGLVIGRGRFPSLLLLKLRQYESCTDQISSSVRIPGLETIWHPNIRRYQRLSPDSQRDCSGFKDRQCCLSIYNDFVYGHGFKDPGIYKLRVNKEGEKLDKILRMVCKDFTLWHGFAVHVNYNMNFRVSSIHHIPFESLRLAKADDDGFIGRTAYHPTGVTEIRRGPDGHRLTSSGFISSTGSGGYSEPGRRSWRMGQL